MAYCPERKSRHTNCEVPKYWGVNFQSPDVANAAPPSIGLDVASEKISNAEVCKTALETAGTVAGMFYATWWWCDGIVKLTEF